MADAGDHADFTLAVGVAPSVGHFAGVVAGMFSATQTAVNGQLGVVLGAPVEAALVSFTVGTLTLLVLLVATRTPWRGVAVVGRSNPRWMWIGGLLGATIVYATAALGPILGTGMTVVSMLLGMLAGSLLIDTLGLLGATRRKVAWTQVLGLMVIIMGVWLKRNPPAPKPTS